MQHAIPVRGREEWGERPGPGLGASRVTLPGVPSAATPADFGPERECLLDCCSYGPYSAAPSLGPGGESCHEFVQVG